MKIKKLTLLCALVFAGVPLGAASADTPPIQANQQTHYTDSANTTSHPRAGLATPMAVLPPTGWINLSGKVKSFDRTSETLQIRDKAGNLYLIPMDHQVTIQRNGKAVEFTQLHRGDSVRLHMTRIHQ
jgi:hypothetical protein